LFTADFTYGDATVAKYYGLTAEGTGVQKLTFGASSGRSGVLTHAGLLARNAGPSAPSPVRRGHMIREQFLCSKTPPPPPDLNPTPPTENGMKQIREQVLEVQQNPDCGACHKLMDGFGLTLERFDAVGLVRELDAGRPVLTTGEIMGTDFDGVVDGPRALGEKLAGSEHAGRCFVQQFFRFAMGREDDQDAPAIHDAWEAFKASKQNIRELIVGLVSTEAFRFRKTLDGEIQP
jgi:hypothetical protein